MTYSHKPVSFETNVSVDGAVLTMTQSGQSVSFRRWHEFVVTELAPAHHIRENSQRSLTTHRFTVTFLLRSSLTPPLSSPLSLLCRTTACQHAQVPL
uniref:Uncharacterized protein n=1 Tax=Monopterus albus TaxID=43700 RepID=A0A3Q3J8U1_MONAL